MSPPKKHVITPMYFHIFLLHVKFRLCTTFANNLLVVHSWGSTNKHSSKLHDQICMYVYTKWLAFTYPKYIFIMYSIDLTCIYIRLYSQPAYNKRESCTSEVTTTTMVTVNGGRSSNGGPHPRSPFLQLPKPNYTGNV